MRRLPLWNEEAPPSSHGMMVRMQVLVGCMELVIFDRFEVQARDEFHRILQRVGYNAERKTMLLDSHLRALRYVPTRLLLLPMVAKN